MAEWWVRSLSFQARLEQMALPTVCDPSGRGNRRYYIAIVMTRKLEEKYTIFGSHLFLFGFALLLLLLLLLLCLFFFLSFFLSLSLSLSFFPSFFFNRYFLHLHFQCYPKSAPHAPPPTHSHFLALAFPCTEAYKVCKTKGPLFPVMAD